jgi:tRNA(Ile2) C34 agmatinyltransferase TiaS
MAKKKVYDPKFCWNCNAKMEDKGDYTQCPKCGTTWTDLPDVGKVAAVGTYYHESGPMRGHHLRPNLP